MKKFYKVFFKEVTNCKACLLSNEQKQHAAGVAVQSRRNPMPIQNQFIRQAAAVLLACVLITGLLPGRAAAQMAHYKLDGNLLDNTGTYNGTAGGAAGNTGPAYTAGPDGFGHAADFSTSAWQSNLGTWNPEGTFP